MRKKNIIIIICVFVIVVLGILLTFSLNGKLKLDNIDSSENNQDSIDNDDENNQGSATGNNGNNETVIIPIKFDSKTIAFYKNVDGYHHSDDYLNETEISKYECTSEACGYCNTYTVCSNLVSLKNGLVAVFDYNVNEGSSATDGSLNPSKIILWDVNNGKEIARYDDIIDTDVLRTSDSENQGKYIILKNKNSKSFLYDLSGNYINDVSDKQYVLKSYEGSFIDAGSYLVENDIIVTIKDNKQGVENITKGEILINHKYDEVMLYDSFVVRTDGNMSYDIPEVYAGKYFKARNGSKWSLYNFKDGSKVFDKEYDKIYLLDENTIAVYNDGFVSFIDYNGNNVSDDKIKVSSFFEYVTKNPEGIIFLVDDEVVKIFISEGTSYDNSINLIYEYNLETKKLTKIN